MISWWSEKTWTLDFSTCAGMCKCPSSTQQNPGNLVMEKEGKGQWCGILLKLAAPSFFEVSRELHLSTGWKSGEGRWHLLVTVTRSIVVCSSPSNSNSLYKWGPGRLMLEGALLQPSDTSLPGLAGADLSVPNSPLEGKAFPCSGFALGLFKLEWTLKRTLSALAFGDWVLLASAPFLSLPHRWGNSGAFSSNSEAALPVWTPNMTPESPSPASSQGTGLTSAALSWHGKENAWLLSVWGLCGFAGYPENLTMDDPVQLWKLPCAELASQMVH